MDRKYDQNQDQNRTYAMLDLNWKEEYNTSIAEIDYQHRYFLTLIKRITVALEDKNDFTYRQRLLTELVLYAKFHFYSEENIMIHCGYSGFEKHKAIHIDLIDLLTNEVNSMVEDSTDYNHLIKFLLKWFVRHTMEEDKQIAAFVNSELQFF